MKTVVITGASTGIGRAAAEHLAAQGWKVFAGVRKQEDADALTKANPAIEPLMLDVTKPEEVEKAAAKVAEALGGAVGLLATTLGLPKADEPFAGERTHGLVRREVPLVQAPSFDI